MRDMIEHQRADETRRSFVKNGVLAASTVAVGTGLGAGATTVGARQDGVDEDVLLFADNFYPQQEFEVVAQLEQSTTIDILQVDGDPVEEISQPDEWDGYIIRYHLGSDTAGVTTYLFARDGGLEADDVAVLAADASVFSPELNLLRTTIGAVADEDVEDEDELDDEPTDDTDEPGADPDETDDDETMVGDEDRDDETTVRASPCENDGERYDWCE